MTLLACQEQAYEEVSPQTKPELIILEVEYSLYRNERALAYAGLSQLEQYFADEKLLLSDREIKNIEAITSAIQNMQIDLLNVSQEKALGRLRHLKALCLYIGNYIKPPDYYEVLWEYEEQMNLASSIATDRLLALYEWGEFAAVVECMNDKWLHLQELEPDATLYRHIDHWKVTQDEAQIKLQKAMDNFNFTFTHDDHIRYSLCEAGEKLKEAYIDFLSTLVQDPQNAEFKARHI